MDDEFAIKVMLVKIVEERLVLIKGQRYLVVDGAVLEKMNAAAQISVPE